MIMSIPSVSSPSNSNWAESERGRRRQSQAAINRGCPPPSYLTFEERTLVQSQQQRLFLPRIRFSGITQIVRNFPIFFHTLTIFPFRSDRDCFQVVEKQVTPLDTKLAPRLPIAISPRNSKVSLPEGREGAVA